MNEVFYLGKMRVEPCSGGYWLYFKEGRGRFVPKGSNLAKQIEEGREISLNSARVNAAGTHEPMVYYRDSNGSIGIPPSPDSPIPDGYQRLECRTLADADKLAAEMTREQLEKFQSHEDFTAGAEAMFGSPRKHLVDQLSRTRSNIERDTIRVMLEDLDREASDRGRISAETIFRWRN